MAWLSALTNHSIGRTCLSRLLRSKSLASLRSPLSSTVIRQKMDNRTCPSCGEKKVEAWNLHLHALYNKKVFCKNCKARVKGKPEWLPLISIQVFTELFLISILIAAAAYKSWLLAIAGIILAFAIGSTSVVFGRLVLYPERYERKNSE